MSDKYHYLKTEYEHEWSKRDLFFLDKAFINAFFSDFTSSLKLGACVVINKKNIIRVIIKNAEHKFVKVIMYHCTLKFMLCQIL